MTNIILCDVTASVSELKTIRWPAPVPAAATRSLLLTATGLFLLCARGSVGKMLDLLDEKDRRN